MDSRVLIFMSALFCLTKCAYVVNKIEEEGTRWAVLVAGSSGFNNYRHQADICHAYQLLHNDGVPDNNIVVMMYDDIAYNPTNPYKGNIINRPDGTNVYEGIAKDYTREDVTPENFLAVLRGDAPFISGKGTGKVVDSGPNDRIFVNLVDHGAVGIFGFPETYLHARKFVETIITMHRNNRFKEMVIYLESCESGSIFYKLLPDDINVYAMTASSPNQPSYACYFDQNLGTFIGDYFSVKWMEDTDRENLSEETFDEQFHIVSNETRLNETTSRYGDLRMENEVLGTFLGTHTKHLNRNPKEKFYYDKMKMKSAVLNPDVPIRIIEERLRKPKSKDDFSTQKKELLQLLTNRNILEGKMKEIVMSVTLNWDLTMRIIDEDVSSIYDWECYEETVDYFHSKCFNLGKNTYALRFLKVFAKLCSHGYSAKELEQAMSEVCNLSPMSDII